MDKLKKNESGFSAVEVILVLVIVLLLGVVGWFVYKNQNKTTPNTTTPTVSKTTPTQTKTITVDPSTKWTRVSSSGNKFSLIIPDGWKIINSPNHDNIYVADDISGKTPDVLKIIEGTKTTIIKEDVLRGGIFPFNAYIALNTEPGNPPGTAVNFDTVNGVKVIKYEDHPTESHPDTAQPGDVEYSYTFEGTSFIVSYIHVKGVTDHLTDIEKIVKSVRLSL